MAQQVCIFEENKPGRLARIAKILIPFLVFPFSLLQAAEPIGWRDLGLYGGQIYAIAIDPADPNTIFAGSYYGDGLFKSTDGGENWQSVNGFRNEIVYSISFDPENPHTIWVATAYYIYKSEDGGLTWELFDPALTFGCLRYYYSLAIDPQDRNTVYVGTSGPDGSYAGGRVFKTANSGETWEETSLVADHNVWSLAINPCNSQEIWAVTGPEWVSKGSIYRSRDRGMTWSKVQTNLEESWFYIIVINPRDPNILFVGGEKGVFRTNDGGVTWSQLEPYSWCRGLALDPENPDKIYAGWYDSGRDESVISKSSDGGDNWVTYDIYPLELLCLRVNPENCPVLYGGDANLGVYKSNNNGENWHAFSHGINANHVFASASTKDGEILVGSESGIFLENGGGTWEELLPFPGRSVAVSPGNKNTLYAGVDWGFGKSIDAGENWSFVFIPSNDPNRVSSFTINPQNPDILYLGVFYSSGNEGEIYKSTDGGETVRLVKALAAPVNVVKVNPNNTQVVYAGSGMFYAPETPGGVYVSRDRGETWEEKGLTGKVVNSILIDAEQPNTIYAGCGGGSGRYAGLYKSTDGGEIWEEKDYGIPEDAAVLDIGIDTENSHTLYAATHRHGIYISYNGGDYWTLFGLSDYWLYDILVSPSHPSPSKLRKINERELTPASKLYAGSGSGIFKYTGSGIGTIAGLVTDASTATGITGAILSTDTGGTALSLTGSYVMVVPAGLCTVSASMEGYQTSSQSGVTVASGEETTVNLSLMPLSPPNMRGFETNLTSPPAAGDDVQITFTPGTQSDVYYQWYAKSGIGTSTPGGWQMLADWSVNNNVIAWSPTSDNRYLVLAHVAATANSAFFHQIGLTFETRGNSPNPIQITKMTTNLAYPQPRGTPITLNTAASGGKGQLFYKYFYRFENGGWNDLGGWSPNSSATWNPSQEGRYTIVVHVSADNSKPSNPLNQAGMTCTIGK